ncbi:MAG: TerC family protein, partial [Flavobacteriales bacterium]
MTPVDELFTFSALVSLVTLAMLEIALGIDNVIFVSLILGRMPKEDRKQGRRLWVIFGILMRSGLLIGLTTLMKHGETTLFSIAGDGFSLRHVILFCGGIFLLYKAVMEIHDRIQGDPEITTNV